MKLSRRGFFSAVLAGVVTVPFVGRARAATPPVRDDAKPAPAKKKIIWIGHSA